MSGLSFVQYISGGKTIWAWLESTRSCQSFAPSRKFVCALWLRCAVLIDKFPALTKWILTVGFFFTGWLFILWMCFLKKDCMWRRTESWRQVYLCPSKANAQLLSMWCIVHFSALHNGHVALVVSPHNFNKFGVINQLTDAFKTNWTNDLLTFPQIRFFHERWKGNALSDHFSQMPRILLDKTLWNCTNPPHLPGTAWSTIYNQITENQKQQQH